MKKLKVSGPTSTETADVSIFTLIGDVDMFMMNPYALSTQRPLCWASLLLFHDDDGVDDD